MRSLAVMLAAAALAAACSSGGASKSARVNELVFTRADGSHIAFGGHVAVTCEPATAGVPPVLRVLGGQRTPGGRRPFWILQVALTDLNHEHTFRFPRDDVAGYPIMFALDANRRNELSSSDEEARGRLVFSKATCDDGVKFRLEAHLGSEFFDQPGVDVRGRFASPPQ
jgi:hypothetical protein